MVWYSYLFQNFPQFIMIHTLKGFGIFNKTEIDVFLELSRFFDDPATKGIILGIEGIGSVLSWRGESKSLLKAQHSEN